MERIFKIKTKSNRNPLGQYPSERRYSASIVIGLSVIFLQLFLFSLLMGGLIIHKMTVYEHQQNATGDANATSDSIGDANATSDSTSDTEEVNRLWDKVNRDLEVIEHHNSEHRVKMSVLVCSGCFLMSLGCLLSACTGLLAWKRWYIDHNITFFFTATTFSTITTSINLLLCLLAFADKWFDLDSHRSALSWSLLTNITILAAVGVVWSFLSTKVAYEGMKRDYPDDMVINKGGGHMQVSTVMKGNKHCNAYPPDIISHFPAGEKLAKYLPRKEEVGGLPKAESTLEYRQRVDRFLEGSGEPDGSTDGK